MRLVLSGATAPRGAGLAPLNELPIAGLAESQPTFRFD